MSVTIDRFEGDIAICEVEAGIFVDVPKLIIPAEAKEGDVLSIFIDSAATKERKKRIDGLMKGLFAD